MHPRLVAVGWAKAQQVLDRRCNCTVICPPPPDAFSEELLLGPGGRSYTWECHAFHAPARGSCACSRPACSLLHVLRCKPRAIWQLGLWLPRLSLRLMVAGAGSSTICINECCSQQGALQRRAQPSSSSFSLGQCEDGFHAGGHQQPLAAQLCHGHSAECSSIPF